MLRELLFYQTTHLFNLIKLPQNNLNIFTYLNIFSMTFVFICLITFVHYDFNKIKFQIIFNFVYGPPVGHRCWVRLG